MEIEGHRVNMWHGVRSGVKFRVSATPLQTHWHLKGHIPGELPELLSPAEMGSN